jgi:hypothetical protein
MSSIPCPDSLQFSPESQIEPAKPGPIHYVLYRRSILPPDFPERAGIFWSRYLFRRFIAEYHLLLQVLTVLDCLSLHPRVTIQQKPSGRDPNVPPLRPLAALLLSSLYSNPTENRSNFHPVRIPSRKWRRYHKKGGLTDERIFLRYLAGHLQGAGIRRDRHRALAICLEKKTEN